MLAVAKFAPVASTSATGTDTDFWTFGDREQESREAEEPCYKNILYSSRACISLKTMFYLSVTNESSKFKLVCVCANGTFLCVCEPKSGILCLRISTHAVICAWLLKNLVPYAVWLWRLSFTEWKSMSINRSVSKNNFCDVKSTLLVILKSSSDCCHTELPIASCSRNVRDYLRTAVAINTRTFEECCQ